MPPFNGSGNFSTYVPGNPVIPGTVISATAYNATQQDIAAGLSNAVTRDGQSPLTANLPAAGRKITGLGAGVVAGDSLRFEQLFSQGAEQDIASAATVDIGSLNTTIARITGTTTITSFGTNYNGPRYVRFAGALTLTHSATLVLPGGANITTAAGDAAIVVPIGNPGTGWRVVAFAPVGGTVAKAGDTMTGNLNVPSLNGGQLAGFRNLLINGNFQVNQRGYVSGAAVGAANTYTLDRWRVVVSGQSLVFSASGNGSQITAPAGGVEQVIEGVSVGGGTYVLNWTGTATATVNGTARAKGESFTLTAGSNATVRLIGGTASLVQLEPGMVATPFEQRTFGMELALCQRYYWQRAEVEYLTYGVVSAGFRMYLPHPVAMRTSPTVSFSSPAYTNASTVVATTITQLGMNYGALSTASPAGPSAVIAGISASAEL